MHSTNRRLKLTFTSIIMIVFVAVSTSQLSSMLLSNGNVGIGTIVYAKYSNSQAQSLVNDCGVGDSDGNNCANNGPITQGDGTASSPINLQISSVEEGGPANQPGPAGQPVLGSNLVIMFEDTAIPPGRQVGVTANCPPDMVAISGGYHGSGSPGIFVYANVPTDRVDPNPNPIPIPDVPDDVMPPTAWFVGGFNTNTGPEFEGFTAYVICAPVIK